MSAENVEIVRATQEAWSRGDAEEAVAYLDDAIEWEMAEDEPDARTLRGIPDVLAMIGGWIRSFDDFSVEVLERIDAGDDVVVPVTVTGRPRGSAGVVTIPETQVFTVRDGRIVRVREYRTKAEALAALGLDG